MERDEQAGTKKPLSVAKLVLFAIACLIVMTCLGAVIVVGPQLAHHFIKPAWLSDFQKGLAALPDNPEEANRLIKKALKDSERDMSVAERMQLYRQYAQALYDAKRWKEGDEQIDAAIALCPNPGPNSAEADQLTHAYQDRGWANHGRWLQFHNGSTGEKDQEQSVAVAEKCFGPQHEQTISKIPSLAIIYVDLNENEKAHAMMQRAIDAVENSASAKECGWFVYAMDSRMKGVEGNARAAVSPYLKARSLCVDDNQKTRCWDEFKTGLRQARSTKIPELVEAKQLLAQEKFSELDILANRLRNAQTPLPNGNWVLDSLYVIASGENENFSEADYAQRIFELKKWLKQNPQSVTARVALADCYTHYAWAARGGGYADSVTDQGWKNFASRLDMAKALLDADPLIRKKCPVAYSVYDTIALGQGMDKDAFLKQQDACHKQWPTYRSIDASAYYFLLPRWHGEEGDSERYITARANSVGGPKGDELYTQLCWRHWYWLDYPRRPGTILKWPRVKSGFEQVLAHFPDDLDTRIAYLDMALSAHDFKSAASAFDGYKR